MALTDKNKDVFRTKVDETENLPTETEKFESETPVDAQDDSGFDGVIDLTSTQKKRFNVNRSRGDSGVLELITSDFGIVTRLENLYPRLEKLSHDAAVKQLDMKDAENERAITKISQGLTRIDSEMRQIIDEIFDAPVSEVCAPAGTMFDPFNGEFRFEHIIDVISKLYENNLNQEFKKMSAKMKQRTAKYTGKKGR